MIVGIIGGAGSVLLVAIYYVWLSFVYLPKIIKQEEQEKAKKESLAEKKLAFEIERHKDLLKYKYKLLESKNNSNSISFGGQYADDYEKLYKRIQEEQL